MAAVHPGDRTLVQEAMDRAMLEDMPYSIEHRVVRPDGSERVIFQQGEVIRNTTGGPANMYGTLSWYMFIKQWVNGGLRLKL